jgi:UDP-glucose 4-epimerase
MNILITGSGFLAKATADLLQAEHHCIVVSRTLGCFTHQHSSEHTPQVILADLNDEQAVVQVLHEHHIQIVIHLAREKNSSDDEPKQFPSKNLLMTQCLVKCMQASGVHHLIFASSAAVYGTFNDGALSETSPLRPSTENGRDKLAIEQYLSAQAQAHPDFRILALRFFNLVIAASSNSSSVHSQPSSHLISQLAYALANEVKPTLEGDFQRDYLSCEDAAKAIEQSCAYIQKIKGQVCMNIGSGRSVSARDVLKIFERILAKPISVEWANSIHQMNSSVADISLAKKLLGFSPRVDLEQICLAEWRRLSYA